MNKSIFHGIVAAILTEAETLERLRLMGGKGGEDPENVRTAQENVARRFNEWLESIPERR